MTRWHYWIGVAILVTECTTLMSQDLIQKEKILHVAEAQLTGMLEQIGDQARLPRSVEADGG